MKEKIKEEFKIIPFKENKILKGIISILAGRGILYILEVIANIFNRTTYPFFTLRMYAFAVSSLIIYHYLFNKTFKELWRIK